MAQGGLGFVFTCWCVRPVTYMAGCGVQDASELVSAHWWTGPGPELSGGQGQVPGQLKPLGFLWQSACWLVGLCPCPTSCLAWGVPGLVPIGWWVGPSSSTNMLKGGFQNDAYQHKCNHGRMSSPKWLLLMSVFPGYPSCFLPLWRLSKISKWVLPRPHSNYSFFPGSWSV